MKVIREVILTTLASCSSHHDIDQKKDPIRFGMMSRQRQFTQCFLESDSYKRTEAHKIGSVKVWFSIDKSGIVTDEKIEKSEFNDANLHACILEQIRGIKFLAPTNGETLEVSQPINFTP
jgi:TonB family protein